MQQESPLSEIEQTQFESPSDGPASKITRKTHRKSRAGCKNCKTRRIKCDESKPHCINCKRRQVRCEYATQTEIEPMHSGKHTPTSINSLCISQIELTYHWTASTCHTMSAWPMGAIHWQNLLESVALHNQHVLHLMFTLTALHLASCRPERQDEYKTTAEQHYECALALVTPEITNLTPDNCDAVFLSVQLVCFVCWAKGPRTGEYLAFGDNGRSEWLVMFRGVRTTLDSLGREKFSKTHAPAIRSKSRPLPSPSAPLDYNERLHDLREHVAFVTSKQPCHEDMVQAVEVLIECYDSRYGGQDSEYHVVFAWLYRMSDDFLEQLQRKEPVSLIIYAHFIVLMHEMEQFWYMKGWTHHIMAGIYSALPIEYRAWTRWPASQVGWIAP